MQGVIQPQLRRRWLCSSQWQEAISQHAPQHLVLVGNIWQLCCFLTLVGGNLPGRCTTLQPWCFHQLSSGLLTGPRGCRLLLSSCGQSPSRLGPRRGRPPASEKGALGRVTGPDYVSPPGQAARVRAVCVAGKLAVRGWNMGATPALAGTESFNASFRWRVGSN